MKKTIIALAVASAASLGSVAQADNTTLYGSVRMSVENSRINNGVVTNSGTTVNNAGSRFGIRGSDDLGNGLTANYRFEFAAPLNGGTVNGRLAQVGLSGSFGTVTLGSQWTPYYNVLGYNDLFNGSFSYANYLGPFRAAQAISYSTPDMGGFSASLAVIANGRNGATNDKAHVDAFNIAIEYANNGIYAGLSYLKTKGNDASLVGGAVGYSNDTFKVALSAERASAKNLNLTQGYSAPAMTVSDVTLPLGAKPLHVALGGEYYIDEANTLRAQISTLRSDSTLVGKINQYVIGYQHNFSPRTLVWAEYEYLDMTTLGGDRGTLSLGLRSDF